MKARSCTLLICLAGGLASFGAGAEPPQPVAASAMTVTLDPHTGNVRPATAQEAAALQAPPPSRPLALQAASASGTPRTAAEAVAGTRRLKDGTEVMAVPLSAMSLLHATEDSQGRISLQHTPPAQETRP